MSIGTKSDWGELERRAARHEASVSALMTAAGLPPVKIEVADRLRGAIASAMVEIEMGKPAVAWATLREALKLS